jgi:hypothetical protein
MHVITPVPERMSQSALGASGAPERPTPPSRPSSSSSSSSPRLTPPPGPFTDRKTLPLPGRTIPPPRVAQHTPPSIDVVEPRMPTGPQLPVVVFHDPDAPTHITGLRVREDLADAPTNIASTCADREDPTDVSGPMVMPPPVPPPRMRTATAEIVKPRSWAPSTINKVVQRVNPPGASATRTWLLLCALFAIAVTTAILIAML